MSSETELARVLAGDGPVRDYILKLQAEAALGRLLGSMAHELRNPLNSVMNITQLLLEKGEQEAVRERLLPVLARAGTRMRASLDAIDSHRYAKGSEPGVELGLALNASLGALVDSASDLQIHQDIQDSALRLALPTVSLSQLLLCILQRRLASRPANLWIHSEQVSDRCILTLEDDGVPSEDGLQRLVESTLAQVMGASLEEQQEERVRCVLSLPASPA